MAAFCHDRACVLAGASADEGTLDMTTYRFARRRHHVEPKVKPCKSKPCVELMENGVIMPAACSFLRWCFATYTAYLEDRCTDAYPMLEASACRTRRPSPRSTSRRRRARTPPRNGTRVSTPCMRSFAVDYAAAPSLTGATRV
ncbi:hypothetical protein B0H12DRAFT_423903 [Mycena haematopus]|nr:hypothetical protein B0H12DRAFT_423903 [Mycena haematopus]